MSLDVIPIYARFFGSWHIAIGRRPFRTTDLEGYYDRQSGVWQAKIDRFGFEGAYAELISRVLCHWRYRPKASRPAVLDAGIGTGAMAAAFAKAFGRPHRLVGVDISADMLGQVQRRFAADQSGPELYQADLAALPFADHSFDVVLIAHVLEHMSQPERVTAELHRVLKPGGMIIACITRRSWIGAYVQLMWRTHLVDAPVARRWLQRAGFRAVRSLPLPKDRPARRWSIGYVALKAT
ncbi:MAG: class I SAM-dependent methyltransferase [Pseudomonadota bacterium]